MTGILIPFQCIMLPTYINLRAMGLMNTLGRIYHSKNGVSNRHLHAHYHKFREKRPA